MLKFINILEFPIVGIIVTTFDYNIIQIVVVSVTTRVSSYEISSETV